MRSFTLIALAVLGAVFGVIVAVATAKVQQWTVGSRPNAGDNDESALAALLFDRPVAELRQELQERGYALSKVSDILQALENLHFVLPLNDNDERSTEPFYYTGGYFSRRTIGDSGFVYDVGPSNPNLTLVPHNEMGYGPRTPRYIAFGAKLAATGGGGETILLDGHQVFARLQNQWQTALETRNIRYRVRFDGLANDAGRNKTSNPRKKQPQQTSWYNSFGTNTPQDAVEAALAMGYHQAYIMAGSDSIQTIYDSPAVVPHPLTRQPCMLEQIVGAHGSALDQEEYESTLDFQLRLHHTTWAPHDHGIGMQQKTSLEEELEKEFLENLDQVASELAVRIPIPSGHILVVDNIWHKHGRLNFLGDREMLVTMRGSYRGTADGR
ncbi:taurine catabolism dioxygenase TauD/TfdA family protein [Nitzschia inconspicua]|uniref:Taurine catabolism dioxygenase TauD/TfdA family protein n=1 Tax=Nitzschia inconspicua TaxID=303405 RepID=A0A9K3KNQ7_9STRA|nr:taurine catabolism dioxygenase TauD/TfdA family protein [Nitzschia inconspicua]KAG7346515.1 taurine catabolism dioxygenase TauD/TfdA family protein [Nitzschia inconspicua]